MKKILILVVALALLSPVAVHAFSLLDVINFGKRLIERQVQPTPVEVQSNPSAAVPLVSSLTAENKFHNWENAYVKQDVSDVIADSRNLYFTDAEINYLLAQELALATDPVARDVSVNFTDNLIKISGYSLVKNFSGQFYLEGKIVPDGQLINIQITKARYHNFYFPAFLAQALLRNELKPMLDFLYSDPDYQTLSVSIGSGFIQLNYGNQ